MDNKKKITETKTERTYGTSTKYKETYCPNHPRAHASGCVYTHILMAEKKIGRYLSKEECVHHIDRNRHNNSLDNLMVFSTQRDHTNYHSALRYGLDFALTQDNGVYKCEILREHDYGEVCPICGGHKSRQGKVCIRCTNPVNKKLDISAEQLSNLLETYSYSAIGRIYNASSNAVKKLAQKYGLYKKCFKDCPDVQQLIKEIQNGDYSTAAKFFNVSVDIIYTWVKKNNIVVDMPKYICLENGYKYDSSRKAAKAIYPFLNNSSAGIYICKSCKTGKDFKGYHWLMTDKKVYQNIVA